MSASLETERQWSFVGKFRIHGPVNCRCRYGSPRCTRFASHSRTYSLYIWGKRSLKANATPLPITPTQFTVLTSVWACDENMSPVFVVTIFSIRLLKEQMRFDYHIQIRELPFDFSLRLRTRYIHAVDIGRRNGVEHKHFST